MQDLSLCRYVPSFRRGLPSLAHLGSSARIPSANSRLFEICFPPNGRRGATLVCSHSPLRVGRDSGRATRGGANSNQPGNTALGARRVAVFALTTTHVPTAISPSLFRARTAWNTTTRSTLGDAGIWGRIPACGVRYGRSRKRELPATAGERWACAQTTTPTRGWWANIYIHDRPALVKERRVVRSKDSEPNVRSV